MDIMSIDDDLERDGIVTSKATSLKMELRVRALHNGNDIVYARLCDELGITPEDNDAYERGNMEIEARSRSRENYVSSFKETDGEIRLAPLPRGRLRDIGSIRRYLKEVRDGNVDNGQLFQATRNYGSAGELDLVRMVNKVHEMAGSRYRLGLIDLR